MGGGLPLLKGCATPLVYARGFGATAAAALLLTDPGVVTAFTAYGHTRWRKEGMV